MTRRIGRPPEPCVIDGVTYPSQVEAARMLGVAPSAISKQLARERRRAPICSHCGGRLAVRSTPFRGTNSDPEI